MSLKVEWKNKQKNIPTMEYFSAIEKNKIFSQGTTWVNFRDTMLSERSQFQKVAYI